MNRTPGQVQTDLAYEGQLQPCSFRTPLYTQGIVPTRAVCPCKTIETAAGILKPDIKLNLKLSMSH